MGDVVTLPYFLNFFVPLVSIFITVFIKIVSRNDRLSTFKKEDFAIGLEIAVTALILFITDSVKTYTSIRTQSVDTINNDKVLAVPWIILFYIIFIWIISTLIRKNGWKTNGDIDITWGIVVPDIFGIISLFLVVGWIGG